MTMLKKDPWFRNRLIRDGIYRAIHEAMKARPEIYIMGEGSHMKVHFDAPAIEKEFPERVITLPISEDANSNFAVGLTLAGLVPIVDVISSDFLYRTMDAVCNTMAKAGTVGNPRTMVVRAEFLTGGPTSGQRIEALFAHIPGLRVAIPSNPLDAYYMMVEALARKTVTVFFEDREILDSEMPAEYLIGTGDPGPYKSGARIASSGMGPTVVSYGLTARRAEDALMNEECSVIDLRHLYPLDVDTVIDYVSVSRKLLVVEPDTTFLGIGAELVAQVCERLPGVAVRRLGGPHKVIPASREQHDRMIPSKEQILAAFKEMAR